MKKNVKAPKKKYARKFATPMYDSFKEETLWENQQIIAQIDVLRTIVEQSNAMHTPDVKESLPDQGYFLKLPHCEKPMDKYDIHYLVARTTNMRIDQGGILPNVVGNETNFLISNGAFSLNLKEVLVLENGTILFGDFNEEFLNFKGNRNPWEDSGLFILNMDSYAALLKQIQKPIYYAI